MAEVKVTDLPLMTLEDFTSNDRFLMVDNGDARAMPKTVFVQWLSENVQGERGEQGVAGRDGARGANGRDGIDGSDGLSAYQIAVQNGFSGSLEDWLNSLKGEAAEKGEDGDNGWSPVVRVITEGTKSALEIFDWVGGEGEKPTELGYLSENGVVSDFNLATDVRGERGLQGEQGVQGEKGETGDVGAEGVQGEQGLSAYDIVVLNGFEGTEDEWLLSLNPSEVSKDPNNIIQKKIDGMFAPATDPLDMANKIDALEDKNIMTDAQKSKLESLKSSMYLGTFLSSEEIPLEGAVAGNYADVDSGEEGVDTERWIFDENDSKFVKSISLPASETAESVKEKYESNDDTNVFTDLEKAKLEGLEEETEETIKTKYESNPDTNAFTDDEKAKLAGLPDEIPSETEESIKTKYESNPNTNAFTDADKLKLDSIVVSDTGETEVTAETPETIKSKYESNPDTNAFTDSLLSKLESLPTEGVKGEKGDTGAQGIQGEQGKSAFEIAVSEGFSGTQEDWLESLKGEQGLQGIQGIQGEQGLSAYDIAVSEGFSGTQEEWLDSLKGEKGDKGEDLSNLNVNDGAPLSIWYGTQEELELLESREENTIYLTKDSKEKLTYLPVDITGASGVFLSLSRDDGLNYTTFNLSDPEFTQDEFFRFVSVGRDNSSFAFVGFPIILRPEHTEPTDEFGIVGFNAKGRVLSPRHPSGYIPEAIGISQDPNAQPPYDSVALPPFSVTEVVNTITAKATEGVPKEQDIFYSLEGASEGGTVTVHSYSTIAFNT